MADKIVKYVPVFIPEDALNEWEKAKTVTINGVTYVIPVGVTVDVPETVSEVVKNWLTETKKAKEEYKKRMKELEEAFR
ncbi:MAG: hypothetical protein PHX79_05720 [Sphaerochaetaceae bacterium]|nr:hypothetical protein [Sphaerochaetaceae bacterium]